MNNIDLLFKKIDQEIIKEAYPNYNYRDPEKRYDLNKWVLAMQKIKSMTQSGLDKYSSIDKTTQGWKEKELSDFLNWMKYYESGDFVKYKFASLYNFPTNPGYYLKVNKSQDNTNFEPSFESNNSEEDQEDSEEESKEEYNLKVRQTKEKVLSRLRSIDKIIDSDYGRSLLGSKYNEFIDLIYSIMRQFKSLEKVSKSNTTYNDLIIREANVAAKAGKQDLYNFAIKLAQAVAPPPAQNNPPTNVQGNPGLIPPEPPSDPANQNPDPSKMGKPQGKGIKDFVAKLDGNFQDLQDNQNSEDDDFIFVSEAQIAPIPTNPVEEGSVQTESHKNYDSAIDNLFKNVKVEDVVSKLETLSNIFKEREIPRQLAIVDMMLNALNLSPMFPGLSESHNKALESNNYILTRIDDVLSKLRGTIKAPPIDLEGKNRPTSDPKAEGILNNLKEEEALDAKKKDMRKKLENEALKETPEIEVLDEPIPPIVTEAPKPAVPLSKPIPPKAV